jgi:transposase-like protein
MVGRPKGSTDEVARLAFWRMHISGWLRSDLSIREYCAFHEVPRRLFMRWRGIVKHEDLVIERKALRRGWMHHGRKRAAAARANGGPEIGPVAPVKKGRRRHFAADIKRQIVEETCQPGMTVSEVARRYGITTNMLFGWRNELGLGPRKEAKFLPVEILDAKEEVQALSIGARSPPDTFGGPEAAVEVELADGRRVRFDQGIAPETMQRVIVALEGATS